MTQQGAVIAVVLAAGVAAGVIYAVSRKKPPAGGTDTFSGTFGIAAKHAMRRVVGAGRLAQSPRAISWDGNFKEQALVTFSGTVQNNTGLPLTSRVVLSTLSNGVEFRRAVFVVPDIAPGASLPVSVIVVVESIDPPGELTAQAQLFKDTIFTPPLVTLVSAVLATIAPSTIELTGTFGVGARQPRSFRRGDTGWQVPADPGELTELAY
jgi:xanthosine utilization system XapX-like protein